MSARPPRIRRGPVPPGGGDVSLINEMLRDLEARRAGELGKRDLQRDVRPLPGTRPSSPMASRLLVLGSFLTALVAGGALWWWSDLWPRNVAVPEPAPIKAVTPPAAAPAALSPVATAPVEVSPDAVKEALSLSQILGSASVEAPPASPAEKRPAPSQARPPVAAREAVSQPGASRAPASAMPLAEAPAVKPKGGESAAPSAGNIEKTIVLGTPRERADAEYRRAQALLAAGGSSQAPVEALQLALKQDGTHLPARQLLLKVLLESRRIDEGMALLQESVEQQPAQIGWAMSLARLQVERGDLAAAEHTLARSQSFGAASAEYAGFQGYLLHRMGQFREAAERYLAATRIAPAEGRWWFGLGQALEGSGRAEDARQAFRRALEAGNLNADLMTLADRKVR
ncbi:MAG: hypothetical protein H6R10_2517 [Rhodocyclaceae bacterium]|nr:hypothetical protein [Rhodocyclaceae bacterium]